MKRHFVIGDAGYGPLRIQAMPGLPPEGYDKRFIGFTEGGEPMTCWWNGEAKCFQCTGKDLSHPYQDHMGIYLLLRGEYEGRIVSHVLVASEEGRGW